MHRHVFLAIVALSTGALARSLDMGMALNQARNVVYCSPTDIANHQVSGCDCRPKIKQDTCRRKCDTTGCTPTLSTSKDVDDCSAGCGKTSDGECKGCGLWFHSVCGCVKDPTNPKVCLTDKPIGPLSGATWVHLKTGDPKKPREHDLITSTSIIPGILDMTTAPSPHFERGWTYAQEQWRPDAQALAMNPWLVRTMEQVHIHLCNQNDDLKDLLSHQPLKSNKELLPLDIKDPKQQQKYGSLFCIGSVAGKTRDNFVQLLADKIKQQKGTICPELFGAGMMMDGNKRTWACATTERHGPLGLFCKG